MDALTVISKSNFHERTRGMPGGHATAYQYLREVLHQVRTMSARHEIFPFLGVECDGFGMPVPASFVRAVHDEVKQLLKPLGYTFRKRKGAGGLLHTGVFEVKAPQGKRLGVVNLVLPDGTRYGWAEPPPRPLPLPTGGAL